MKRGEKTFPGWILKVPPFILEISFARENLPDLYFYLICRKERGQDESWGWLKRDIMIYVME
jgi:hypothetical protein